MARLQRRLANDTGFAARLRRAAGTPLGASRLVAEWYGFAEQLPVVLRNTPHIDVAFLVATLFAYDRRAYRLAVNGRAAGIKETGGAGRPEDDSEDAAAVVATPGRGTFGATLAALRKPETRVEEDAMTRRLILLLDAELELDGERGLRGTLPWRLRHAVTIAVQQGRHINWARLFDDLVDWTDPVRRDRVRRAWAQDYHQGVRTTADKAADHEQTT